MAILRIVIPVLVLLMLAWSTIYFSLSPIYTFILLAVIYAFWVLTPPYPDAELLMLPVLIGLITYVMLKVTGKRKVTKRRILLYSTILAFILTYATALLILYMAITIAGITSIAGFNIDLLGWAS